MRLCNADPVRTSRSFSKVRSHTVSPSVGSFQVPHIRPGGREDHRIERLPRNHKRPVPQEREGGTWIDGAPCNSPKRLKAKKSLELEDIEERETFTPRSLEHYKKTFAGSELGPEADKSKRSPLKRIKGDGTDAEAMKTTPTKLGKGRTVEVEGGKSPGKRKKGVVKNLVSATDEEPKKEIRKVSEFEPDTDDEGTLTKSDCSLKDATSEGPEAESPTDEGVDDANPSVPPRKQGKRARNSKNKKPVAERISVSTKTRASAKAAPTK